MTSLKRLLLASLLATLGTGVVISTALSYYDSLIETNELFDAKLAQTARVFRALAEAPLDQSVDTAALAITALDRELSGRGELLAVHDGHAYESKLALQVFDSDGRLRLRSTSAPVQALAPLRPGFGNVRIEATDWRSFVLPAPSGRWYLVAESAEIRDELAREIAAGTALPALVILPLLALLVVLIVSWALRSIRRVAAAVEARPADRLDPIALAVPQEIASLVAAINRLFARVDLALAREARFTADAAHELRTPISALKLHAQNLAAGADAQQRQASLDGLMRTIARCERLVVQLLELARLERAGLTLTAQAVDLVPVARAVLAELAPEALRRKVELVFDGPEHCLVTGDATLLAVMVRNLIENAIRHGPADAEVHLIVEPGIDMVQVAVSDAGPGIAEDEQLQVLERFHRGSDARAEGSGIGLSIVARIADLHGARLGFVAAAQGRRAQVQLQFPPFAA